MYPFEPHDDELCKNCGCFLDNPKDDWCDLTCENEYKEGY